MFCPYHPSFTHHLCLPTRHSYERALRDQPAHPDLINSPLTKPIAGALFASGNVLVLTSMWALGVTGTYLGDYFGILMDHIVTGFPFNVTASPMYWGSTMSFLGTSLWFGKPAGILLTFAVYVAYWIALKFEEYICAIPLALGSAANSYAVHLPLRYTRRGNAPGHKARRENRCTTCEEADKNFGANFLFSTIYPKRHTCISAFNI
jgi:hypothetical protein